MFNYPPFIGLVLFGILLLVSVRLSRKSFLQLSREDKLRLVEVAGGRKGYVFLVLVIFMIGWYLAVQMQPERLPAIHMSFLSLLLGLTILAVILNQRRIAKAGLPETFRRNMLIASLLRFAGLFALALSVLWPLLRHRYW